MAYPFQLNPEDKARFRLAAIVLEKATEVQVRDQGVGIEQENLAKVFEAFFTTKGNLGTGIGLWVTK